MNKKITLFIALFAFTFFGFSAMFAHADTDHTETNANEVHKVETKKPIRSIAPIRKRVPVSPNATVSPRTIRERKIERLDVKQKTLKDAREKKSLLNKERMEKRNLLNKERREKLERLREERKIRREKVLDVREKHRNVKEQYKEARKGYLKEVGVYKNTKKDFREARKKFKESGNEEYRKEFETKSREHLKRIIHVVIKRLEAFKKLANSPKISESDRSAIIAELDKDINWLNGQLEGIDTATYDQIKAKAKVVRDYWRGIRFRVKRISGLILAHRINFVILKLENFAERIEEKINILEERGVDTTDLERLLSDFREKIAAAKNKFAQAKEKFRAISSLQEANALFREGHKLIRETREHLREAHRILVKIVKEIRNEIKRIRRIEPKPVPVTETDSTTDTTDDSGTSTEETEE